MATLKSVASKEKTKATKKPTVAPKQSTGYWFVKSEPSAYSFEQLKKDKKAVWDGIRNYEARNNLRAMKKGDNLLFYHSTVGKEVVGTATVLKEAYQDPSTEEDWSVVEIGPKNTFSVAVSLEVLRSHPMLKNMEIHKKNRLSVATLTKEEFDLICDLGTKGDKG